MLEYLKLKKVNKSFVPEPKKIVVSVSSVFGFLYAYEHYERYIYIYITRIRILVVFLDLYVTLRAKFESCIDERIKKSKVGDRSRGWPEGSFFESYYTKV